MPDGKWAIYHWLHENDYPDGFQTLCYSCNREKWTGPFCPRHLWPRAFKGGYGEQAILNVLRELGGQKRCVPVGDIIERVTRGSTLLDRNHIYAVLRDMVGKGLVQHNRKPSLYWLN